MLVFPHWRSELPNGCRVQRWMPTELAPYLARPVPMPLPMPPTQYEDEESSGGSSPERAESDSGDAACGWRGCGARCPSVARLSAHVARVHAHAHADGLFYCGWSNCSRPHRGFNARYKMLVHVRTHTNERPHTCNQCQKSFSRAENLKIHLRSHSGEKPYVCPYEGCGKAYSNSSDRFKHTRTHAVEKPYCCKVAGCNKRYTDPSSLRKHVKTYKHFTNDTTRRESSEETVSSDAFSTLKESPTYINDGPLHTYIQTNVYSPNRTISPPNTNIIYSPQRPISPVYNSMTELHYPQSEITYSYIRPDVLVYQRVPDKMSYLEYTHMYEHSYRNYYKINYPVLRPAIGEKVYSYEGQREDVSRTEMAIDELPLNLMTKRFECRPIEELVKCTDYPLDLSTKS